MKAQTLEIKEVIQKDYVFGSGGRTAAKALSSSPGNMPEPPPPKLRAPEEKSGTPSAEQSFAKKSELENRD